MTVVVPSRFRAAVDRHLVMSYTGVAGWPLILGVFGRPGDGKSFQLRAHLSERGVAPVSINAADLESDRAGLPGKMILDLYQDAGHRVDEGELAAVVIDDVDTTVGEWEHSTTTVNHQQVLAQLMHLADDPTHAAGTRLRRVPVILTGNDLGKIYPPLRRPGRMRAFPWLPTESERVEVVGAMLSDLADQPAVLSLLAELPDASIAFFSDLRIDILASAADGHIEKLAGQLARLAKPRSQEAAQFLADLGGERLSSERLVDAGLMLWQERAIATKSYVEGAGS